MLEPTSELSVSDSSPPLPLARWRENGTWKWLESDENGRTEEERKVGKKEKEEKFLCSLHSISINPAFKKNRTFEINRRISRSSGPLNRIRRRFEFRNITYGPATIQIVVTEIGWHYRNIINPERMADGRLVLNCLFNA